MNLTLEKRDRICFLGDSITANGRWIAEITEFFLQNYPELEIGLYNCGISGSKGYEANVKNRLYADCLNLFPKYVVVMFGMNDTWPHLYNPNCPEPDKVEKRERQLAGYRGTLEEITGYCKKEGVTPILCAPTAYDEYNDLPGDNHFADIALRTCRDIAEQFAKENGLIFVDMHSTIKEHISEKPVSDDRVHPNEFGHHLMAEAFLTAIGAKDKPEPNKACVLSETNQKRFETEQKIRTIMFLERDCMLWQYNPSLSLEERKKQVQERMDRNIEPWIQARGTEYFENVDYLDELRGELVKLTREMYH